MLKRVSKQLEQVLRRAEGEARGFGHHFVGTEHLLLAVVEEGKGVVADVFLVLGIGGVEIRKEIEKRLPRAEEIIADGELPLTSRARRVMTFATEEANLMQEKFVLAEHLLLGLIRETDGVAGRMLRSLGLKPEQLKAEVFRIRLAQMRIVEKAVRPVRAGIARKRRMREELLAHLMGIYEEENERLGNPVTAMREAVKRFGDSEELGRDLDRVVPFSERFAFWMERSFGWRAGETVTRYGLRMARDYFVLFSVMWCLIAGLIAILARGDSSRWVGLKAVSSMVLIWPAATFFLVSFYYRMRNAMWGVFGARRSWLQVCVMDVLVGVVLFASLVGMLLMIEHGMSLSSGSIFGCGVAAIVGSLGFLWGAYFRGPQEIRDTMWACLDLSVGEQAWEDRYLMVGDGTWS